MARPDVVKNVAQAIYEYAGVADIPPWDSLAPTIQIYYIEQAEASLEAVCRHLESLAYRVDCIDPDDYLVKGTMVLLSKYLDPKNLDE